jgi:methylated-DNA-[protein]-cysteine S-methyltransferase
MILATTRRPGSGRVSHARTARRFLCGVDTIEGRMTIVGERQDTGSLLLVACGWDAMSTGDEASTLRGHDAEEVDPTRDASLADLCGRVQRAVEGRSVDFSDLRLAPTSPFFAACRAICQAIPAGTTISYGELAARAGSPKAARAAGQAMRRNPMPIIVPCHRVVASSGELGGYGGAWSTMQTSTPSEAAPTDGWGHRNCDLKARLLAREAAARRG